MTSMVEPALKKVSINFSKAKAKFYLSLHYIGDSSYLFVYRQKLIGKLSSNLKCKLSSSISFWKYI